MLGLIALSGHCEYTGRLREICSGAGYVVAADGGMRHLDRLGIRPDLLAGDMDSIPEELLRSTQDDRSIEIRRFGTRKDRTDSGIAAEAALSFGCDRLAFIGATGSRPDHVLANQMMAASIAGRGIPCLLTDGVTFMHTLTAGNSPLTLPLAGLREGQDVISIVPVNGDLAGLTIRNLEYPLLDRAVAFGSTEAVSNTVPSAGHPQNAEAELSLASGIAFVILTTADPA